MSFGIIKMVLSLNQTVAIVLIVKKVHLLLILFHEKFIAFIQIGGYEIHKNREPLKRRANKKNELVVVLRERKQVSTKRLVGFSYSLKPNS